MSFHCGILSEEYPIGRHYYFHFIDAKADTQRDSLITYEEV